MVNHSSCDSRLIKPMMISSFRFQSSVWNTWIFAADGGVSLIFRMDAHALDNARCGCGPMASCTDDLVKRKTEQPESQRWSCIYIYI